MCVVASFVETTRHIAIGQMIVEEISYRQACSAVKNLIGQLSPRPDVAVKMSVGYFASDQSLSTIRHVPERALYLW